LVNPSLSPNFGKIFHKALSKVEVKKRNSFLGHRDSIYALQSAGNNFFYSAAGDGMIVRWDLNNPEEGELVAQLPKSIYALLFLEEQNQLVAAQNFSGIHLLDPTSKKEIASLQLTSSHIFDLKLNNNELLVGTGEGQLITVDMDQWRVIRKIQASEKSVRSIAVNRVSNEIVIGCSDYSIQVFDSTSYQLKKKLDGHTNSVFAVNFTPDGKYLISGGRDAHIRIWDAVNEYQLTDDIAAHYFAINAICFSPDGKHFATCSLDKSIKLWSTSDFQLLKVIDKSRHAGHGTSVNKLLWVAQEGILLSASDDRSISSWNLLFL
jgi:WD40 repeat protein